MNHLGILLNADSGPAGLGWSETLHFQQALGAAVYGIRPEPTSE